MSPAVLYKAWAVNQCLGIGVIKTMKSTSRHWCVHVIYGISTTPITLAMAEPEFTKNQNHNFAYTAHFSCLNIYLPSSETEASELSFRQRTDWIGGRTNSLSPFWAPALSECFFPFPFFHLFWTLRLFLEVLLLVPDFTAGSLPYLKRTHHQNFFEAVFFGPTTQLQRAPEKCDWGLIFEPRNLLQ